ncbi:hypothetical protein [Archaeoglobus neptunius]|uniref:hypothetical protein n=1 Tax=Archaeoglobus neptunius TaxID=2798580 RepID=UPI0019280764|nr:hypothetical protein [Archaeoglobus neptunius]
MNERTRNELFKSLNLLSVVGSGVMTFAVVLLVLHYSGFSLTVSIVISLVLAGLVILARMVKG